MEPLTTSIFLFIGFTLLITLSGVLMPGPVLAATIAKGYNDKKAGLFVALGHGAVEIPLIFLLYFGFARFFSNDLFLLVVGLVGGVVLVLMGYSMLRNRKNMQEEGGTFRHGPYVLGMITTASSPYFFLWWATIGLNLIIAAAYFGFAVLIIFVFTHWSVDYFFYSLVGYSVNRSKHLWTERVHEVIFGICGLLLLVFGIWFVLSAVW